MNITWTQGIFQTKPFWTLGADRLPLRLLTIAVNPRVPNELMSDYEYELIGAS